MSFEGNNASFSHPRNALKAGIRTIHQDVGLCLDLSVLENIFLGQEETTSLAGIPVTDTQTMREKATEALQQIGGEVIPLDAPASDLSGGQKKSVALARLIINPGKLLLFDEPTAALGEKQKRSLLDTVVRMKDRGSIIFISHDMDEVKDVADRIIVLHNGLIRLDAAADTVSKDELRAHVT